ncbi:hypothetical protein L2E82_51053 [Cichorium intybus]|nr:hypothetical protein L2E82_51053 [Cichorium intybus]
MCSSKQTDFLFSGDLSLEDQRTLEVPDEVYKSLDAVGEGENWWEAVELQKLILAHNEIELLKEDIRNLHMLSVLNISHNKLSHLPSGIGELKSLKALDVSSNLLHEIPEEIGSATSLIKFDCSSNQLKELPCSLRNCKDLSDLKVWLNNPLLLLLALMDYNFIQGIKIDLIAVFGLHLGIQVEVMNLFHLPNKKKICESLTSGPSHAMDITRKYFSYKVKTLNLLHHLPPSPRFSQPHFLSSLSRTEYAVEIPSAVVVGEEGNFSGSMVASAPPPPPAEAHVVALTPGSDGFKKETGRLRKYGADGKPMLTLPPMPFSLSIPLSGDFPGWKQK